MNETSCGLSRASVYVSASSTIDMTRICDGFFPKPDSNVPIVDWLICRKEGWWSIGSEFCTEPRVSRIQDSGADLQTRFALRLWGRQPVHSIRYPRGLIHDIESCAGMGSHTMDALNHGYDVLDEQMLLEQFPLLFYGRTKSLINPLSTLRSFKRSSCPQRWSDFQL